MKLSLMKANSSEESRNSSTKKIKNPFGYQNMHFICFCLWAYIQVLMLMPFSICYSSCACTSGAESVFIEGSVKVLNWGGRGIKTGIPGPWIPNDEGFSCLGIPFKPDCPELGAHGNCGTCIGGIGSIGQPRTNSVLVLVLRFSGEKLGSIGACMCCIAGINIIGGIYSLLPVDMICMIQ